METITLFYLTLGLAIFLIIALCVMFSRYNKLKVSEKSLKDECKTYVDQLYDYKSSECRALNNNERLKAENQRLYLSLQDKVDFLNSLNERVQKAEAERDLLRLKLSRKGTGVKGSKKQ